MTSEDEKTFAYILSQLPTYVERVTPATMSYFPELADKITDQDLLDYIADPKNTENLLLYSPPTSMWLDLKNHHIDNLKTNKAVDGIFDNKPYYETEFVINTYPLSLTPAWAKVLKHKLSLGLSDHRIKFGYCCSDKNEIPIAAVEASDFIFSYWFDYWFSDTSLPINSTITEGRLRQAKIYGYPLIANEEHLKEIMGYTQAQLVDMEVLSRLIVGAFAEFEFYRPKIELASEKTPE